MAPLSAPFTKRWDSQYFTFPTSKKIILKEAEQKSIKQQFKICFKSCAISWCIAYLRLVQNLQLTYLGNNELSQGLWILLCVHERVIATLQYLQTWQFIKLIDRRPLKWRGRVCWGNIKRAAFQNSKQWHWPFPSNNCEWNNSSGRQNQLLLSCLFDKENNCSTFNWKTKQTGSYSAFQIDRMPREEWRGSRGIGLNTINLFSCGARDLLKLWNSHLWIDWRTQ